jgi:hypothetical protein
MAEVVERVDRLESEEASSSWRSETSSWKS